MTTLVMIAVVILVLFGVFILSHGYRSAYVLTTLGPDQPQVVTDASIALLPLGRDESPLGHEYRAAWYRSTGAFAHELAPEGCQRWTEEGELLQQVFFDGTVLTEPPWRNGASDNPEPSAPWIEQGVSFEVWWDSLPKRQRYENFSDLPWRVLDGDEA